MPQKEYQVQYELSVESELVPRTELHAFDLRMVLPHRAEVDQVACDESRLRKLVGSQDSELPTILNYVLAQCILLKR